MKTQKNQGRSTRRTVRRSMCNDYISSNYTGHWYPEDTIALGNGGYAKTSMNSKYGY